MPSLNPLSSRLGTHTQKKVAMKTMLHFITSTQMSGRKSAKPLKKDTLTKLRAILLSKVTAILPLKKLAMTGKKRLRPNDGLVCC